MADQSIQNLINALGDTKYKIVTNEAPNGTIFHYKIKNDIAYHLETDDKIITILEYNASFTNKSVALRPIDKRIRIYYGDVKTGRDWGDKDEGYIGRTTGKIKRPILVHNTRSSGGSILLDDCIVKIEYANKKRHFRGLIYQHPNYHKGEQ